MSTEAIGNRTETASPSLYEGIKAFHRLMREMPASLAVLTVGRLALVPLMILSVGQSTLALALSLAIFIAADLLDGVVARRHDADDCARRALDSIVDRVAIWSVYGAAVLAGLLPLAFFGLLALRDAYCAYQCGRIVAGPGIAIKADWMYRGLNLMLAAWVLIAPHVGTDLRQALFALILVAASAVAVDLTRSVSWLLDRSSGISGEVVSATRLRRLRSVDNGSEPSLQSA